MDDVVLAAVIFFQTPYPRCKQHKGQLLSSHDLNSNCSMCEFVKGTRHAGKEAGKQVTQQAHRDRMSHEG